MALLELPRNDLPPQESSPIAGGIPGSTISALRDLFIRMVRAESPVLRDHDIRAAQDELRDALQQLCEDARRNAVRAEQLLIAIKQGWASLHQDHPRPRAAGPDELLNHVITVCIGEYYAETEAK